MKRRTFYIIMAAEAVVLCAARLLGDFVPQLFTTAMAFPFEQIGMGLNALSSLGAAGRGAAAALLAGISFLPMIPVMRTYGDRERRGENIALTALTLVLLPVLYCMSSPSVLYSFAAMPDEQMLPGLKMVLGGTVWSVAACWLVLRLLRIFRKGKRSQLMTYLERMLIAACLLFTAGIFTDCLGGLTDGLKKAQLPADGVLAAARFAVSALPYIADIAAALAAMGLLERLSAEGNSEASVEAARTLSSVSAKGLGAVVISSALFSVIQLAVSPMLSDIQTKVNVPVLSLVFVLAMLLLARLIAENKRLSEDNNLFI